MTCGIDPFWAMLAALAAAALPPGDGSAMHSGSNPSKSSVFAERQPGSSLVPDDMLPTENRHGGRHGGGGPPAALLNNFTLNGAMALEHLFVDDRGTAGCWSVDGRVDCSTLSEGKTMWTFSWVTNWTNFVRSVDTGDGVGQGFQNATMSLRKALSSREDEIRHKHAVIVGSQARGLAHAVSACIPPLSLLPAHVCAEAVV